MINVGQFISEQNVISETIKLYRDPSADQPFTLMEILFKYLCSSGVLYKGKCIMYVCSEY